MFCAHCGKEILGNAAFCAFCGKETVKRNDLSENEEKSSVVKDGYSDNRSENKNVDSKTINRKALIAVIIGIAALCVVVGIAIFLNISGKVTDESSNVESSAYNNDMSASESEQSDEKKDIPRLVIKSNQGSLFDDKSQKNYLECNYDTVYLDEESAKIYPELGKALSSYSSEILESQKQVVDKVKSDPGSVLILSEGRPLIDNKEIKIVRADRSVISTQSLWTIFYYGPHERYTYEGASFDSKTGIKLELEDIVKSKEKLIPIVKQYIIEHYYDDLLFSPQSKVVDEIIEEVVDGSSWLITDGGIKIIVNEGRLSSLMTGALFVDLSFNEYPDLFTDRYTNGGGVREDSAYNKYTIATSDDPLNQLIKKYFNYFAQGDVDELEKIVSPFDYNQKNLVKILSEHIEGYQNIAVYYKDGPVKGSYLVSVYHETKFKDINTRAPGLTTFYIHAKDDGTLFIDNRPERKLEPRVVEYINIFKSEIDVMELANKVNSESEEALKKDKALYDFITNTYQKIYDDYYRTEHN